VVRHFGRIEAGLAKLVAHPPRFATRAVLFLAGFELIEAAGEDGASGRAPKIVHHAVTQAKELASAAEARMVNAVVRRLAELMLRPAPAPNATAEELAEYFSHPVWLIKNWLAQFGPTSTRELLEWNQRPAPVYARWRRPATSDHPPPLAGSERDRAPEFLRPTRWPGYLEVTPGHWGDVEPLLKAGHLYLQDPAGRIPVDLLAPRAHENVLDLCAAPGGKSLLIADRMAAELPAAATAPAGRLVAVDLPGPRIARLKENLARAERPEVALVQASLLGNLPQVLREHRLPVRYPAILLDVPCSNTGVMRHRVDVKWRLQPGDLKKHPQQQLALLQAATRLCEPGGRLVYSTCSIDAEENEHVVQSFLASPAGRSFALEQSNLCYPWTSGHDSGAAFLLRQLR
jgi:16S rRNA (cytosine967-C5)-methyltransferase